MLTNLKTIKKLCAKYSIKPNKQFGQNFLVDEGVLNTILDAADIQPTDTIIEIGAGIGTLTHALAEKAKHVYAFEVDERMYPILQETVPNENVNIIKENVLQTRVELSHILKSGNYKIISNIPYNITGILVRLFLELVPPPEKVVVMVQKEVAMRMTASKGKMSMLSVAVQYYATPKIVRIVPPKAFYPPPRVDSAVLEWKPRREYNQKIDKVFFDLVRVGFVHPRKMLKKNLLSALGALTSLEKIESCFKLANISKTARPGELTVENWINLHTCLNKVGNHG